MRRASSVTRALRTLASAVGLSTALALGSGACLAQPSEVDLGKRVYISFCARCHGINMVSTASGFFDLRQFPPDNKARFVESVTKGLRAMPAWGDAIKPDELDQLWAYVLSNSKVK